MDTDVQTSGNEGALMTEILTVLPDEILFLGRDLLLLRDATAFRDSFGAPSRSRDIKMHPSGIRVAMVWDDIGLVAYEDLPEGLMSHLHLAYDPSETPEHPIRASTAIIEVNGAVVTGETTERKLPKAGATPIVTSFGRRYYHKSERYVLDFAFEKRRDDRGRKHGLRRLAHVSFSWQ
jgi:hypothetical protein